MQHSKLVVHVLSLALLLSWTVCGWAAEQTRCGVDIYAYAVQTQHGMWGYVHCRSQQQLADSSTFVRAVHVAVDYPG